jgi:diadenosine tetraphosphate (Ap4A) HIT family hydrolase
VAKFELHPDLQRDGILIGEFPLSLVLLINDSAYPWFVLVPRRAGIKDAIDLDPADYRQLSEESRLFSIALKQVFAAEKLNVAALGNMTPQLHVHHIVRSSNDAAWPKPIWGFQPLTPYTTEGAETIRQKIVEAQISGLSVAM